MCVLSRCPLPGFSIVSYLKKSCKSLTFSHIGYFLITEIYCVKCTCCTMMGTHEITDEELLWYIEVMTEIFYPRSILVGIHTCMNSIASGQCAVSLVVCMLVQCVRVFLSVVCVCVCVYVRAYVRACIRTCLSVICVFVVCVYVHVCCIIFLSQILCSTHTCTHNTTYRYTHCRLKKYTEMIISFRK